MTDLTTAWIFNPQFRHRSHGMHRVFTLYGIITLTSIQPVILVNRFLLNLRSLSPDHDAREPEEVERFSQFTAPDIRFSESFTHMGNIGGPLEIPSRQEAEDESSLNIIPGPTVQPLC